MRQRLEFEKNVVHFDEKANKSVCLKCNRSLSGRNISNIKRHYKLAHNISLGNDTGYKTIKKKPSKNIDLKIYMDRSQFLKCCVGLVTVKNIPFRIFNNNYFKKIIKLYEDKFEMELDSTNIIYIVEKFAEAIKKLISERVKNKTISLKVDVAMRKDISVLGINIQYIKDFKLHANTIGMVEMTRLYNSKDIKNEISRCLQEVGIKTEQIYPTSEYIYDNGSVDLKTEMFSQIGEVFSVLKCPAYYLQLVAKDGLKEIEEEVNRCQNIFKKLYDLRIKNFNFDIPNFHNLSKWETIYSIMECLLSQKTYIEFISELVITEMNWKFIENFVTAFKPLFFYSLNSQNEQYIVGDFFRDWLNCELELQDNSRENIYANHLYKAMSKRKIELFNHITFLAALYLDPRFNFENSLILTDYQKKITLHYILERYEISKKLGIIAITDPENTDSCIEPSSANTSNMGKDNFDKLTKHIEKMIANEKSKLFTSKSLKQKLLLLCERNREALDINVLEYWKTNYENDVELCHLAEIIFCVPTSQVSKERTFSALSTIITKLGSRISKENLEHTLLCKSNFDMLETSNIEFIEKDIFD